jgi:tRNA pseudouridine38-40 synthase
MAHYQVILVYDGTEFRGFQKQAEDRTVQGAVEEALRQLGWQGKSVLAAGRTDTGVHASGQVIAFDLDWRHSEDDLLKAFNAHLPPDIAGQAVRLVDPDFHPRFDAVARRYCYHIFCQPARDPLRERFAWRVWPQVNVGLMQQAAQHMLGKHDFSAFGSPPIVGGGTLRTVYQAQWLEAVSPMNEKMLIFEITADAFLYHMVRKMVSFQVSIGQGFVDMEEVLNRLDRSNQRKVQGMAPPQGLVLAQVYYDRIPDETSNN